ncbi:hypothetical protein CLOSTASPAR_03644 [[Clostridium] asparagiforme DSM 15981]|uniref:Uncharacterized protein n=1 Tax=[Clostridium] asparagiforme DSM 15981 TaxID=518636 RepID=C0D304_9FIRM|nr:hypothetical protein CLOSTASPAR_03644 [[Clostridium] asparagiforme DSM 15981]
MGRNRPGERKLKINRKRFAAAAGRLWYGHLESAGLGLCICGLQMPFCVEKRLWKRAR